MKDSKRSRRRAKQKPGKSPALLQRIQPHAAGIDCGAEQHYVAVPQDRDANPVRSFRTFTTDLHRLADWLESCEIQTVAMESTGVYWIPIYEILEERGFAVTLVNARDVKNVPGRKTDVLDCQWIQELHSVGLLRASFRPPGEIAALRAYLRHREKLVHAAATHVQRMQKALVQMNLQLPHVVSNIVGVTGLRILRDILNGVRDPHQLATHRDHRCKASEAEIAASLSGNYRPEHLFSLQQNLEAYEFHQRQIEACDAQIQHKLNELAQAQPPPDTPLPSPRTQKKPSGNQPRFEMRDLLHRLTGTDLSQITAIGPYTALQLISEIGTDMRKWPTHKHFVSWLTLAPKNRISGGRLLSSKTQPSANRAAALLRICAMSLDRTDTALAAFQRRLAYRVGKAKAITATARKLAILVYHALQGTLEYKDPGHTAYTERQKKRTLRTLQHKANQLGFELLNPSTGELLKGVVS